MCLPKHNLPLQKIFSLQNISEPQIFFPHKVATTLQPQISKRGRDNSLRPTRATFRCGQLVVRQLVARQLVAVTTRCMTTHCIAATTRCVITHCEVNSLGNQNIKLWQRTYRCDKNVHNGYLQLHLNFLAFRKLKIGN